ncbi:Uncharacterized protein dnm_052950 [Desulfonema magnum]|uniref:Uncharacterized protein n=1 Tax=Desulfonema magnum TaxID=45655 RepID=A0A975BQK8_9BACT|nr:Uncharacterized protein dnm_052950 [Desulfonema magnum]
MENSDSCSFPCFAWERDSGVQKFYFCTCENKIFALRIMLRFNTFLLRSERYG